MKILWLTEFFSRDNKNEIIGGVQARCFYVAKQLSKKHHLQVVEGVSKKFAKASLISFIIRLLCLPIEIYKGLNTDFDLVEASNFVMYIPAWIVGKIKKKPLVFWYPDVFIGSWINNVGPVGAIGEFLERQILKLPVDHYIAISNAVARKLVKQGIPKSKISVVYCGVDFSEIKKIKSVRKKKFDICLINRLISYKMTHTAINAVSRLKKYFPSIRVIIIGQGAERAKLESLVEKLKLKDSVIFLGYVPKHLKVLHYLSQSKLFCFPSAGEGFGIAPVEAAALGVPSVVSDIPVLKEVSHNGTLGATFKLGNASDLAKKLKSLLTNKKLYLKKSRDAKKLASQYDWKKIATETEKIYKDLLS